MVQPNDRQAYLPILGATLMATGLVVIMFAGFVADIPRPIIDGAAGTRESADPLVTKVDGNIVLSTPLRRPDDFVIGSDDAPVKIYEFSDFSCTYCQTMATQLKSALTRHPEVQLIWKDFPITSVHADAGLAHVAARCAGEEGKFWEYHDSLFALRTTATRATLLGLAQSIGIPPSRFADCLASPTTFLAVQDRIAEGNALGIDGTPFLFIGDQRISGLLTPEELEQVITLQAQLAGLNR